MPVCEECGRDFELWDDSVWAADSICEECFNEEDEDFEDEDEFEE